jgi:DNA-binding transcriptional ArsR family regulator
MSNETIPPAPAPGVIKLHRKRVTAAIDSDQRWDILRLLSSGDRLCVSEIAEIMKVDPSSITRQMMQLKFAGLVTQGRGKLYNIPPQYNPKPGSGILELGHLVLRLDHEKPPA